MKHPIIITSDGKILNTNKIDIYFYYYEKKHNKHLKDLEVSYNEWLEIMDE